MPNRVQNLVQKIGGIARVFHVVSPHSCPVNSMRVTPAFPLFRDPLY